ncbi:MAG: phenol hydroxylase subunit [Rubrivivax sp.]
MNHAEPKMRLPPEIEECKPVLDVTHKFVRLKEERPGGVVVFDFAIGWPDLSVELMMPRAAFDEFCVTHRVERLGH